MRNSIHQPNLLWANIINNHLLDNSPSIWNTTHIESNWNLLSPRSGYVSREFAMVTFTLAPTNKRHTVNQTEKLYRNELDWYKSLDGRLSSNWAPLLLGESRFFNSISVLSPHAWLRRNCPPFSASPPPASLNILQN